MLGVYDGIKLGRLGSIGYEGHSGGNDNGHMVLSGCTVNIAGEHLVCVACIVVSGNLRHVFLWREVLILAYCKTPQSDVMLYV